MPPRPPEAVIEATPPATPTRRRLLALLATLPAVDPSGSIAAKPTASPGASGTDPLPWRFAEFRDRVAQHEGAARRCGELEARLVAEVGYPRVRLPAPADAPARYAAATVTITEHVPPGPRRDRLHRLLRRRQERWKAAAEEHSLRQAQAREASAFDAVRAAADALHAAPATTLAGVVLKLVALLSLEAPGAAFSEVTPWRELHAILADLGGLAECRDDPP